MDNREEYYARIEKITGNHLFDKTIGVYNSPFVYRAVELLASCGVLGFNFGNIPVKNAGYSEISGSGDFNDFLMHKMMMHNLFENRWRFNQGEASGAEKLILAGGNFADCQLAYLEAKRRNIPAVIGMLFNNGMSFVSVIFPGQEFPLSAFHQFFTSEYESTYFDWVDINNQMANAVKAILLEGTPWQREDVMSLLRSGKNTILLAHPNWPWSGRWIDLNNEGEMLWIGGLIKNCAINPVTTGALKKTILIVGLGSLGSVAADNFRTLGCNIIGIDGKNVSIHNPVRQIYSTDDIGIEKAFALSRLLARSNGNYAETVVGNSISCIGSDNYFIGLKMDIADSRSGAEDFSYLLGSYSPDLVVFATAHPAEFRMADQCRQKNIPHIIGRCYNRARWFEVTIVDGNRGPCFGCLQGHLYEGKPASLTEEQLARYDMAGDAVNSVQAEPATMIDTARCADMISRFGLQFLKQSRDRAQWFARMLSEERTCLIGGNYAEFHDDTADWSFGVTTPGGVALYGIINFIGSETEETKTCLYCGKTHEVLIKRKEFVEAQKP